MDPFLDDGGDGAVMTTAPRSLGEAAEHQPVDSPVAQPERVRPHDLEAVAGAPEITAVDVEHRPDRQLHDPIDTLRIETAEQVVGLGPASELMAVAGGDGVEHTGEHRHRRRPRRRRVGDHRLHEVGCAALGDDETPEVPVDSGSVGDITAAHGDVEGVAQLGEPAGEIAGGRQGDAEGVPGMSLVARRSGGHRRGDGLARPFGCLLGLVDTLESVGAGGQDASAGGSRSVGRDQADGLLVGIEGVVVAAALQQTPPPPFVENGSAGCVVSRIEIGERVGDQVGGPVEVPRPAGDVGCAVDDLGARHWQVRARTVANLVHRRQQPVVVALRLGEGVGQFGVDRGGEGRGDGSVVASGARPVVDEGGGPSRSHEGVIEVDGPGVGGVEAGPLTRE